MLERLTPLEGQLELPQSRAVATGLERYLDLVRILSSRTLKTRYRGSILGVYWSLSNPLLMTGIYSAIFGTAFSSYYGNSVLRYVLATFTGLAVLNIFSNTTSQALPSVVDNGGLLNKVRLPVSVFPLSIVASNAFQFAVGTLPVLCLIAAFGSRSLLNVLCVVFPALSLLLVTAGFSYIASALYVFFRDLPYMYELVLFVMWITSPIFYPIEIVPVRVRPFLSLNPLVPIISSLRQIALTHNTPDLILIGWSLLTGIVTLAIGLAVFHALRKEFMDLL
jgi:ABC-type polysaccharide/polyol phosphate export permease